VKDRGNVEAIEEADT